MAQKTWIKVGGGLLLLAWSPFLYAELTSDPAQTRDRDLPSDQPHGPLPAPEATDETEEADEPPAIEAKAEAVDDPIEPVPAEPDQEEEKAQAEPAPPPGTSDPAAEGEEEEPPPPPPVASGQLEVLKRAFETQPRDALWATETEARIAALFGTEELPKAMLKSTACRKAICRVEIEWNEELAPAYTILQKAVLDTFGNELGVEPLGAPDDEGKLQVQLYLPRKGYTVADLAR